MGAIKFARSAAHPRNFKIASTKSRICCKNFKLNFEIFWCAARKRCGCIFRACGTQNSRRHRSSLLSRRNVWARKTRVRCRDRVNFPRKSSRNRCKYSAFLTRDAPQLQPAPLRKVQNRSAATGCVRCAFDGRKITRSAVHLRKICVDNIRIGCSIFFNFGARRATSANDFTDFVLRKALVVGAARV